MDLVVPQLDMILEHGIPGTKQDKRLNGKLQRSTPAHPPETVTYHFFNWILLAFVPICAAISFFKSPTVSVGEHLTRTREHGNQYRQAREHDGASERVPFRPSRSLAMTSIIAAYDGAATGAGAAAGGRAGLTKESISRL